MPSHSIVQSVLLRRSAFRTLDDAKDWLTEHGYKYVLPDTTPTYFRFRQRDPKPLEMTHRLRTTQLGEPEKNSPMGSIGALILAYPKNSRPMAKDPPAEPKPEPKKENLMESLKVGDLVRVEFTVDIKRKREVMIVTKKTPKTATVQRGGRQGTKKFILEARKTPIVFRKIGFNGLPVTSDLKYEILERVGEGFTAIRPEEDTEGETESESE
jgi:hypothetical protein